MADWKKIVPARGPEWLEVVRTREEVWTAAAAREVRWTIAPSILDRP